LVKFIVSNILLATRYAIINLNYEINQHATSRCSICLGADTFMANMPIRIPVVPTEQKLS
ncbi:MAG: hypothetical protein WB474_00050, partial [Nitrososphaeraceae archaeon]